MTLTFDPSVHSVHSVHSITSSTSVPPSTPDQERARVQLPSILPVCALRQETESLQEYAARCLRFLLQTGITASMLDEQLELAEKAGCRAAASLPAKLDPADRLTAERLTQVRHQIAQSLKWRAEQHRHASQEALNPAQAAPGATIGGQNESQPDSNADRACKLLHAALLLIMSPPDDQKGGGTLAKLIPPTPKLPPSGVANSNPIKVDVRF